jgi:hypothetical protein
MAKPLVVFPDPLLETLRVLRARLPGHGETDEVSCGTVQVESATAAGETLPYLMVALDGSSTRYPVAETAALRVVVWAETDLEALRIAQIARGFLFTLERDRKVRSYGEPSTGPRPDEDPDNGGPMASFTVAARLRPESL